MTCGAEFYFGLALGAAGMAAVCVLVAIARAWGARTPPHPTDQQYDPEKY